MGGQLREHLRRPLDHARRVPNLHLREGLHQRIEARRRHKIELGVGVLQALCDVRRAVPRAPLDAKASVRCIEGGSHGVGG